MSLAQPGGQDARASGLSLNLSSNNPFRNRTASPIPQSQLSPNTTAPPRPLSRNPFLDDSGAVKESASSWPIQPMASPITTEAPKNALTGHAAELFDELTLNDKPNSSGVRPTPPNRTPNDAPITRNENIPPRGPPSHRPTRSQEQAMRQKGPPGASRPRPPIGELNIFADPEPRKSGDRRARRNSDSSLMERKPLDPEDEKKRQERRRRERRAREAGKDGKPRKPDRKLDIIDQLDATSIYGTGLFHHDGPFDACNPHRNRQGSRRAPMQAFPKDSLNNVLGGGGPLRKKADHATFLGNNDEEAFKDYSTGGANGGQYEGYGGRAQNKGEAAVQSSTMKVEPIHGSETLGLGTSTFLEGAPASRAAIQKNREVEASSEQAGGLQRKKSLAQKIRGISNTRRDFGPGPPGRMSDGMPRHSPTSTSPGMQIPSSSRIKPTEKNPFFQESDATGEKKESITIVEPENKPSRPRAPSIPGGTQVPERLERRATTDSTGEEQPKQTSGFLTRMKSLKAGPKRPKTEKPVYP